MYPLAVVSGESGGVVVNTEAFPFVRVVVETGFHDDDFEPMFLVFEALIERAERYALLIDAMGVQRWPGAKARARLGDWQSAHRSQLEQLNVCSAVAVPSALVRGALTAINWVAPPPAPQRACATVLEGVDYCLDGLERAGIDAGPDARGYRQWLFARQDGP